MTLKPCPFCGNQTPILDSLCDDWYVRCDECTAQMVLVGSQAQAALNWNERDTGGTGDAISIVREYERVFGNVTSTERTWLIDHIEEVARQ